MENKFNTGVNDNASSQLSDNNNYFIITLSLLLGLSVVLNIYFLTSESDDSPDLLHREKGTTTEPMQNRGATSTDRNIGNKATPTPVRSATSSKSSAASCGGITFSLDSKYIIEKGSGNIYLHRDKSDTKDRIRKVGSISLEQNEKVVDASDHILVTSQGRMYYFKESPASDLVRINIDGVSEGSRQEVLRKGKIAGVSPVSQGSVCQGNPSGGCSDYYSFSILYNDGIILYFNFGVKGDRVTNFDMADPAKIELPSTETAVAFKGVGDPYASKVQVITNSGVFVSKRSYNSGEGYSRTVEQTYQFEQPLDIVDRVYEGKTEFLYTNNGVKYQGSTKDHSYTRVGNLSDNICSLGE